MHSDITRKLLNQNDFELRNPHGVDLRNDNTLL